MKRLTLIAVVLSALFPAIAVAQDNTAPVSPEKLALARKLFDLSGGQKQMQASINTMFSIMLANVGKSLPPNQQRFSALIQRDIQAGMVYLIPSFLNAGANIYARDLTETELSDYIAFQESPSGQSIRAKSPMILRDIVTTVVPIVQSAMPSIMQNVVVDVCAEAKCSDQDRQIIADAMAKAMPKRQS